MSQHTHNCYTLVYSLASTFLATSSRGVQAQNPPYTIKARDTKSLSVLSPVHKRLRIVVSPHLFPGGLWLELFNPGPMQLFQASICREGSPKKLAQKGFALPGGASSFYWSFDAGPRPEGTFVLIIRGEKYKNQWKLT